MLFSRWLAVFLTAFFLGSAPMAAEPVPASSDEIRSLVATLKDDNERAKLLAKLEALLEVNKETLAEEELSPMLIGSSVIAVISERVGSVSDQITAVGEAMADLPGIGIWIHDQAMDEKARKLWLQVILAMSFVFGVGLAAQWGMRFALRRPTTALENFESKSRWARLPRLTLRTLLELLPLAAFALLAYGLLTVIRTGDSARMAVLLVMNAYLLAGAVLVLARSCFSPHAPTLRLLPVEDETANYLTIWVRRILGLAVFGFFALEAALLLGLPKTGHGFLLDVLGLVVATLSAIFILQNRVQVAAWLKGSAAKKGSKGNLGRLRRRLSDAWHILAVLYIAIIYAIWALEIEGGFAFLVRASLLSLAVVVAARLAWVGLRRAIDRGFSVSHEIASQFPGLETRANRYLPVLHTVLNSLIVVLLLVALTDIWGLDTLAWLFSESGRRLVGTFMSVAVVLLIALLLWETVSAAIERYLTETDDEGQRIERSARARTLLPLLRNAFLVVLIIFAALIILSELGLNVAPLLAGAGVIGLAIGFGSQKLVQDIINGVFILMEDTIQVGEVVKLDNHAGVVEAISIRTIRIRDLNGSVHTIPFSAVGTVVNMTKDFSFYLFEVGIAYREDTDEVFDVLKQIGEEMRADPDYGPHILEPLEVIGVDRFEDSAVILRARFKTAPIRQWMIGREFNRRMKKRFDQLGIEIPFPHRTIYFGENKDGSAPSARIEMAKAKPVLPAKAKTGRRKKREVIQGPEVRDVDRLPSQHELEMAEAGAKDGEK